MEILLKCLAVGVLVFLNGFFVAAEFALVKVRGTQLSPLIEEGSRTAKMAQHITGRLDAYLSAAQLGITLASLGLGWIGEPIFEELLHPVFEWLHVDSETVRTTISFAVGFTVITFLHIVVGEQAPKSFAIKKPLPMSQWVSYPLHFFYLLAWPFIQVLNQSSLMLLKKMGIDAASEHEGGHSVEELRLLLETAHGDAGSEFSREIVLNAMDLRERVAREVMRPRQEIVVLDTTMTIDECVEVALNNRFSRLPLCVEGDVDRAIGVVHIKDLLAQRNRAKTGAGLARHARKLIYIPRSARLERLLERFIERRLHMAVVVDEFGGTEGLITLENVIEELVGQIQDEFDEELPLIEQIEDGVWELNGDLPLHELEELIDEEFEEEEISTTSGLMTLRLGGFPKVGDEVRVGRHSLKVIDLDGPTVEKVRLEKIPEV
ncbi:MAG: HlyC/CorC family transporter [Verrucomicrobiae bacterium]|nr:HlyC/CorC family transporter [Verrucomicrobiae bacterium]